MPLSYTKRVSLLAYALILRYINSFENTNIFCLLPCEVSTKSLFLHCICLPIRSMVSCWKKIPFDPELCPKSMHPYYFDVAISSPHFFFVFPLIFFCECYNKWCHWFIFDIYMLTCIFYDVGRWWFWSCCWRRKGTCYLWFSLSCSYDSVLTIFPGLISFFRTTWA